MSSHVDSPTWSTLYVSGERVRARAFSLCYTSGPWEGFVGRDCELDTGRIREYCVALTMQHCVGAQICTMKIVDAFDRVLPRINAQVKEIDASDLLAIQLPTYAIEALLCIRKFLCIHRCWYLNIFRWFNTWNLLLANHKHAHLWKCRVFRKQCDHTGLSMTLFTPIFENSNLFHVYRFVNF